MKKQILNSLLILLFTNIYSQDTIYSVYYPKGIITKTLEKKMLHYSFTPAGNPSLNLEVKHKHLIAIHYANGEKYSANETPKIDKKDIIFPVDQLTGKIIFTEIVEVKGASALKIYNAIKVLSAKKMQTVYSETPGIKYTLIDTDTINNSFQSYIGQCYAMYAGDLYTVYFQLEVKFKDGKMKYEYSNLLGTYSEQKGSNSITTESYRDFFNPNQITTKYSTSAPKTFTDYKKGDNLYGIEGSAENTFWNPIYKSINESIANLKKLALEEPKVKKDDW